MVAPRGDFALYEPAYVVRAKINHGSPCLSLGAQLIEIKMNPGSDGLPGK